MNRSKTKTASGVKRIYSDMSRTLILTHGDSDGVCSGAIAKSAYPDADVYFTSPVGILDELKMADGYRNIIICDIAIDVRSSTKLYKCLEKLARNASIHILTIILCRISTGMSSGCITTLTCALQS